MSDRLDASVLIATYNRAEWLDKTLASLAAMAVSPTLRWEVIVIDNNSVDDTKGMVGRHHHTFPVPLTYLFESRQGRSNALNTGIAAARGAIIAFTDDDVRVSDGWLEAAVRALRTPQAAYAGGPVRPMWEVPPPRWLDLTRGDLWGTIAIQDHGDRVISYETARKVPLGANLAVRREVFDIAGVFRSDLGRSSGRTLLGQEVPEWLMRVRGAGLGGLYVPAMEVHHHVPAGRLTKQYFRKWWFGKGASRAAVDAVQPVTELGIDLRGTPHILGLPRFMYGTLLRDVIALVRELARRRPAAAFRHEMMIAFFVGYASSRRRLVRAK